jgi:nicotinamide-nucleotide amidase
MDIELIVIGTELLNGKIQDMNAHWLGRYLAKKALCLSQVCIVHDSEFELAEALMTAYQRSDIVITTGGLGPTDDDITKRILSQVFNKPIEYNEEAIEVVTENYKHFEKIPHLRKNGYANLPKDFRPIRNPTGLAPGLIFTDTKKNKIIMSTPGVPHEFQQMFEQYLWPSIKSMQSPSDEKLSSIITIRTRNIPEETIFFDLCPTLWEDLSKLGTVSSLPHAIGVDLVVKFPYANEKDKKSVEAKISEIVLGTPLKDAVWHIGDCSIEEVISQLLKEKGLTIACAESCTGGKIGDRLTEVSGASDVFKGTIVAYSEASKSDVLSVKKEIISKHGVVSDQVASELAKGARKKFKSDVGISTTGYAGPTGGTKEHPVGTVCIGISSKHHSLGRTFKFHGDRDQLKVVFCQMALYLVLEELETWDKPRADEVIE